MKLILLLRHAWNELLLWSATCEVHSDGVVLCVCLAAIPLVLLLGG